MNRIEACFARLRGAGRRALIPYVTAGDPSLDVTGRLVIEMARRGADIVELGVPFSDPLADGPTIQRASQRALQGKTTLRGILALVRDLRNHTEIPLVLMTYYNPIFAYGEEDFLTHAREVGVDGVIVPDLPPDEGSTFYDRAAAAGIDAILLVAPTSPQARIRMIAERSRGFLYYVSLTGVTGSRDRLAADLDEKLALIRSLTKKPVAVGFGISTPAQAAAAARLADAVIVGSALIDRWEKAGPDAEGVRAIGDFIASLRAAIDTLSV
ncbi:MAG: tryptophan synthase subunit alpha [Deltaproteobacteria bacterium RBG_13_65_10]|nr:MAG: tryptophan synthase subunit alpha [Deltaproteobacteria bacterium RBG_13_65_10]